MHNKKFRNGFGPTPKRRCGGCDKPLAEPDTTDMIEAELEYRQNFPKTWRNPPGGRVLICDDCYTAMNDIEPPEQWEEREAWRGGE